MAKREPGNPSFDYRTGSIAGSLHFSHEAMAAVFEIFAFCDDVDYAFQASQAAFEEVDRLEQEMSRFRGNSDISRLNKASVGDKVQMGLQTFECLLQAKEISAQTAGAFDVTIGALYKCWLNDDKSLRNPGKDEIAVAVAITGMDKLRLDERWLTAEILAKGVRVDLGGIGKGYAVDQIGKVLREWEIEMAMIHGGGSSLLAMEPPKGKKGWPVTISNPLDRTITIVRLDLANRALGGSGIEQGMHIIDARRGAARPVKGRLASWSLAENAAVADALSTAFMVMNPSEIDGLCHKRKGTGCVICLPSGDGPCASGNLKFMKFGDWGKAEFEQKFSGT